MPTKDSTQVLVDMCMFGSYLAAVPLPYCHAPFPPAVQASVCDCEERDATLQPWGSV